HRAVGGAGEGGRREGGEGVVGVGVVALEVGLGQHLGRVLGGRGRVIDRHRGVVDGGHGDGDVAQVREGAVADGVVEAGGAVEVAGRGEGDGAVAVEHHRAVGGA